MDQAKWKKKSETEPKGAAGTAFILVHDLLYVLAAITVVFVLFARLTGVHGYSMYPTLVGKSDSGTWKGDYLVLESSVLSSKYKQGDIVVAVVPSYDDSKPIVKRVIATEGQTVDLGYDEDGVYRVFVDGVALEEPYINNGVMSETIYQTISFPATVPENCYFLMGDNRDNSSDSRNPDIGMIHRQNIVGKALFIIFPGQTKAYPRDWSRLFTLGKQS